MSGANTRTTLLLFAYAAGAATSMALALLAGGRVFGRLKKSLGAGEWIRRGLGVAVLLAVLVIGLGWDSAVLSRISLGGVSRLEQSLVDRLDTTHATHATQTLENDFPSLAGATSWLNSPPLVSASLRGKVVLVDFWTYSCINCLRSLPYVKNWYAKYKDHGLVVLGVHAPEFAFEKDEDNVRRAVKELGIAYPVALDNRYAIWKGFDNEYWPAHYFIDAQGKIRGHHFGEGQYKESEQTIRQLLSEAGFHDLPPLDAMPADAAAVEGVQAKGDDDQVKSPETYIGTARATNFVSPSGFIPDRPATYTVPSQLALNQWGLTGGWTASREKAVLANAPGKIVFRFRARDLHLVLGPATEGESIRFRVQLDDAAPGLNHGMDIDAQGNGVVRENRLYQLIRQSGDIGEHTFSIEFLDSGVQAFSFTFG